MANSSSSRSQEYDRSRSISSIDAKKYDELNEKLNLLIQSNQRSVQQVESGAEAFYTQEYADFGNEQQEVSYVNGQGFTQNRGFIPNKSHPNLSYRNPNVENPQDQVYPQQQAQQFQNKPAFQKPFNQGFVPKQQFQAPAPAPAQSSSQDELKHMLQQLMIHTQKSATDINAKMDNMNTKVDGMYNDLNGKFEALSSHVKKLDIQVAQTAEAVKRPQGVFPGRGEQNPRNEHVNAITLGSGKVLEPVERESKPAETERVYVPKVPYPTRPKKSTKDLEAANSKEEKSKSQTPTALRTLIDKGNPGKFNIPVSLGGRIFEDALCDSGSYINLISWELVQELGLEGMRPHSTPLMFGDASKKIPKGMIKECPILVGDCIVKTNMLVIDMVDSMRRPILLGAPFLMTAGAVIDYVKGAVTLKYVDEAKDYPMRSRYEFCGSIMGDFEVEAPSKEEAASQDVKANPEAEIKVLRVEQSAKVKQFEKEVPLVKEATSQTAVTTLAKKGVKKVKKEQPKQAQYELHEPRPPSITLKPSKIIAGKLECKVKSKGYSKPFAKARIILDSTFKPDSNLSVVTAKMANLFGMKLDDPGPFQGGPSQSA